MTLPIIPQDKANHAIYGAAIGLACGFIASQFGIPAGIAAVVGAAVVGAVKEVSDYASNQRAIKAGLAPPHGVEFADFLVTALGGVLVAAASFL